MCLTIEVDKTKKGLSLEKRCWFNSNKNTIRFVATQFLTHVFINFQK